MKLNKRKDMLSSRKRELYEKNSEIIQYYRRNPNIACEDLLGIKLLDAQKVILQNIWIAEYSVLACSRNFGKSFLASVFMILKWLLFEGQQIYIIGSVGSQSIECFKKLEDIVLQRIESIDGLLDIVANETVKSPACKTGFVHDKSSHVVRSHNNSAIYTLNSDPDNVRSKRATLVFFDESAFTSEELLVSAIAFATQNTDFKTSTKKGYDPRVERQKCPTQLLFASSMNDTECLFYKKFQDYAIKMFAGDRRYFVTSMDCSIPLAPLMDGKPFPPLLKQSQIDDEMRVNKQKALREYYNYPYAEGENQMIRNASIVRNSIFQLPVLFNQDGTEQFIIANDPARSKDNNILGVMRVRRDEKIGLYGEIVNCVNFIDTGKQRKQSVKVPEQVSMIRDYVLDYNGANSPDYENIKGMLMDSGAGGQGTSLADLLLEDWKDKSGDTHKGFIDVTHDLYKEEGRKYENASRNFDLVNPQKLKFQMCTELIDLMSMDLIKFPKEYDGKDYIIEERLVEGEVGDDGKPVYELVNRPLSLEERVSLINIDAMKSEILQFQGIKDSLGNITKYGNPKTNAKDDRADVLILLAHKLFELRRQDMLGRKKVKKNDLRDYMIGWKK